MSERDDRQQAVLNWVVLAFGPDHAYSRPQRATRFLEEAIELFQTCQGDPAMAHSLIDYVFAKQAGIPADEIGDVGLTLLSVASLFDVNADEAEARKVAETLVKDPEEMAARNREKNAAGFDASAYPIKPITLLGAPSGSRATLCPLHPHLTKTTGDGSRCCMRDGCNWTWRP